MVIVILNENNRPGTPRKNQFISILTFIFTLRSDGLPMPPMAPTYLSLTAVKFQLKTDHYLLKVEGQSDKPWMEGFLFHVALGVNV